MNTQNEHYDYSKVDLLVYKKKYRKMFPHMVQHGYDFTDHYKNNRI